MKNLLPFIFPFYLSLISCQPSDVFFKDALCIENVSVINPEEGLKENQTLIIKDGKIFKVVPSAEINLASNNKIIDGSGKFLIPGLWDTHVHFDYMDELATRMFDLFLTHGITSVRDTGGKIEVVKKWKDRSLANPKQSPRVMISGPLLDGVPNVYDGSGPWNPLLSFGFETDEEIVEQVNFLDSVGVDLLKAYEMLTPEQFELILQLAKKKDLKVTGHVPLSMEVSTASNLGLNSMEHMRNLELSCASNAEELLQQRRKLLQQGKGDLGRILRSRIHDAQRKEAIENYEEAQAQKVLTLLAKNQTWQIPTITMATNFTERYFIQPEVSSQFQYLPDSMEQSWLKGGIDVAKGEISPFDSVYTKWKFEMVGKIHQAGIEIMAGTDCPVFFLMPGHSLHQELELLQKCGLSPLEVLKTATLNPAKYFDLEEELGMVKPNYWADLVLLDANPLDDIGNCQQIHAVIRQGEFYDRERLDGMLERLKKN